MRRDVQSPMLLLGAAGMSMRRKVVDYRLLQVWFPEIVNAQTTFWVACRATNKVRIQRQSG